MSFLTRTDVSFSVREKIIRTEPKQVEFADIRVIEVISFGDPDEERLIAVFAHQLVQLCPYEIH